MSKYNKLLTRITLPSNFCEKIETRQEEEQFIATFHKQIATAYVKKVDEFILSSLYELYKGKADEVIVINEVEFEKFIKRFLPIYLKEQEEEL